MPSGEGGFSCLMFKVKLTFYISHVFFVQTGPIFNVFFDFVFPNMVSCICICTSTAVDAVGVRGVAATRSLVHLPTKSYPGKDSSSSMEAADACIVVSV